MDSVPVVTITKDAQQLEYMHNADYARMVATLNEQFGKSFRRMEKESGCDVSFAQWAQIAAGNRKLNPSTRKGVRTMIAKVEELADELPAIPDPVEVVAAELIDPDAEMLLVGTLEPGERVRRVVMLAQSDVVLYVNGDIHAEPLQGATTGANVESYVNDAQNATAPRTDGVAAKRERVYRPVFSTDEQTRFDKLGGIRNVIAAGLAALETENGNA